MLEMRPAYCWGRPDDVRFAYAALGGRGVAGMVQGMGDYVPSRPMLDERTWQEVDRALDEARRACELNLIIVLVPDDAHGTARQLFAWAEPGPDVIAIGHTDHSVSFSIDEETCNVNRAPLDKLISDARVALQRGDLAAALLSVASNLDLLRLPEALRRKSPPPIPKR